MDFGECSHDDKGCYPIEGARPVSTIMTRYVSRAIRTWQEEQQMLKQQRKAKQKAAHPGWHGNILRQANKVRAKLKPHEVSHSRIRVGKDERNLVIL